MRKANQWTLHLGIMLVEYSCMPIWRDGINDAFGLGIEKSPRMMLQYRFDGASIGEGSGRLQDCLLTNPVIERVITSQIVKDVRDNSTQEGMARACHDVPLLKFGSNAEFRVETIFRVPPM